MNLTQQLGHGNVSVTSRYLDHIAAQERVEALMGREWGGERTHVPWARRGASTFPLVAMGISTFAGSSCPDPVWLPQSSEQTPHDSPVGVQLDDIGGSQTRRSLRLHVVFVRPGRL